MDDFTDYELPAISLTPGVVSQEKQPALLAPKQPENVFVNFKEVRYVGCTEGITELELDLLVTIDSKTTVVTRKLVINNSSIGMEALNNLEGRKTIYVEDTVTPSNDSRKLRWLRLIAGISYD
jgi:hypothetical protein